MKVVSAVATVVASSAVPSTKFSSTFESDSSSLAESTETAAVVKLEYCDVKVVSAVAAVLASSAVSSTKFPSTTESESSLAVSKMSAVVEVVSSSKDESTRFVLVLSSSMNSGQNPDGNVDTT